MSEELNPQDLINLLTSNNDITNEEAERFVIEFFKVIEQGLSTNDLVNIKDFGDFKLTSIQERERIDVKTQEKIIIPSHRRVSFLPAQTLKTLVNKPFAHFETTPLNVGIYLNDVMHDILSEESEEDDFFEDDEYFTTDAPPETKSEIQSNELQNEEQSREQHEKEIIEPPFSDESYDEDLSPDLEPPIYTPIDSKSSKNKSKHPFLWWFIITGGIVIFTVFYAHNYYKTNINITKQDIKKSDIPKPIEEPKSIVTDTTSQESIITPTIDSIKTVKMTPGRTLRLIALDEYGNREFWVYIYLKNKQSIENPDVIPIGFELVLPNKSEFDIDKDNPEMVAKAKRLGDQEMKKFW